MQHAASLNTLYDQWSGGRTEATEWQGQESDSADVRQCSAEASRPDHDTTVARERMQREEGGVKRSLDPEERKLPQELAMQN